MVIIISEKIPLDRAANIIGCNRTILKKLLWEKNLTIENTNRQALISIEDILRVFQDVDPIGSLLNKNKSSTEYIRNLNTLFEQNGPYVNFFRDYKWDPKNAIQKGHCLDWIRSMPDNFTKCVVTSPPYWGVRRYKGEQVVAWQFGEEEAFGLESSPDEYVRHNLETLLALKRVLTEDGTVWWNVGDIYHTRAVIRQSSVERINAFEGKRKDLWKNYPVKRYSSGHSYLKDKDLTLIPFQIAMGAQKLGYWVRAIIIWSKENTLPEPVKDRPTFSHEYIVMLSKSKIYYYNTIGGKTEGKTVDTRNIRSVWTFSTSSGSEDHNATFPIELPLRCITLGSEKGDIIFDPFLGSGTTACAAKKLGRKYFGVDLSDIYLEEAKAKLEEIEEKREKKGKKITEFFFK